MQPFPYTHKVGGGEGIDGSFEMLRTFLRWLWLRVYHTLIWISREIDKNWRECTNLSHFNELFMFYPREGRADTPNTIFVGVPWTYHNTLPSMPKSNSSPMPGLFVWISGGCQRLLYRVCVSIPVACSTRFLLTLLLLLLLLPCCGTYNDIRGSCASSF